MGCVVKQDVLIAVTGVVSLPRSKFQTCPNWEKSEMSQNFMSKINLIVLRRLKSVENESKSSVNWATELWLSLEESGKKLVFPKLLKLALKYFWSSW